MLNRLKNKSLKSLIQEEIRQYITESGLREGDPLPSEKELAEQLGLSRTSIREALNGLESLGVIEARHGIGWFLKKFDFRTILGNVQYNITVDTESFKDLLEVRICLESSFIQRDLKKFSPGDIATLHEELRRMGELIRRESAENELIRAHADFHCALYRRSNNHLLTDLVNMFSTVQNQLYRSQVYATRDRGYFLRIHKQLLAAIEAQDAASVKEKLLEHFSEPIDWVRNQGISIEIPINYFGS